MTETTAGRLFLRGWLIPACIVAASATVGCEAELPTPDPGPAAIELDVGLDSAERNRLRFLSEGSDLAPVILLQALVDSRTGRLFVDSLETYGFLPSPVSETNPYGLPIGFTIDVPELSPNKLPYVGVNCAACHTGQIEYRGQVLRIDGAPNLCDLEGLALAVRDSVRALLTDRLEIVAFLQRVAERLHPDAGIAAPLLFPRDTKIFLDNLVASVDGGEDRQEASAALGGALQALMRGETLAPAAAAARVLGDAATEEEERHVRTALEIFSRYVPILADRLEFATRGLNAIERSPMAGPGRDDPWGIIRNLLFAQETRLTSPTSIPHLFYMSETDWYHADGNTSSVMERDFAQAVALGGYVEVSTHESSLRPRQIHELEELWSKVRSPEWPEEVLGAIDEERAARGRVWFETKLPAPNGGALSCADCHGSRDPVLVDLDAVGTDPNRAERFGEPVSGTPFPDALKEEVARILSTALSRAGVTPEEASEWGREAAVWRYTGKYAAKKLDGVWATAPYLHNGSVPTLDDLLRPPDERPDTFVIGSREYDPVRVGYVTDGSGSGQSFRFDTSVDGNGNQGHLYGTELSPSDRADLIEYLKTQ